jgi:hypothetical protein
MSNVLSRFPATVRNRGGAQTREALASACPFACLNVCRSNIELRSLSWGYAAR